MIVFNLSKYDNVSLLDETKISLKKYTELRSRDQLPLLWGITDRLNALTFGKKHAVLPTGKSRGRSIFLTILCLLLGVFLFVPGVMAPKEQPVSLIIGAIAILHGLVAFLVYFMTLSGKKRLNRQFEKAALTLLENTNSRVAANKISVCFTESHIEISSDDTNNESIAYSNLDLSIEAANTILIIFDSRAVILQKKDMTEGDIGMLREILNKFSVEYCTVT